MPRTARPSPSSIRIRPERLEGPPAIEHGSPRAHWAELLVSALDVLGVAPSSAAVAYLLDLLQRRLRQPITAPGPAPSLAETLAAGLSAEGPERRRILRGLGERALGSCGFFAEHLARGAVGPDYYVEMGRRAYRELARSEPRPGCRAVYHELADDFLVFLELLSEIAERTRVEAGPDWLLLYDRYMRTGSDGDRRRLIEAGLTPPPADDRWRWIAPRV